jgi:hypothetical protein
MHPFPERPLRILGIIRLNVESCCSEKFLHIVCLHISLPLYVPVYSIFMICSLSRNKQLAGASKAFNRKQPAESKLGEGYG